MSTFVYAPAIRVYVSTEKNGTLDISDDLVQGVINIRTNGVHTFSFQLQNTQRKYDTVLRPMDRITVELKRVTWVRVFSGYLNNGPIFSVWPRVLDMSASCSLKRLQFWYWDSTTPEAVNLVMGTLAQGAANTTNPRVGGAPVTIPPTTGSGAAPGSSGPVPAVPGTAGGTAPNGAPAGTNLGGTDAGIRETLVKLLVEVVGWPQEKIHIAEVPKNWWDLAGALGNEIIAANNIDDLVGDFKSGGTIGGTSVTSNGSLPAGDYGGTHLDQDQANNASVIYNVGKSRGLPDRAEVIAIATAMQESGLHNLPGGDRDSAGLFQQRPSQGWGTLAQVTDPVYASGKFYDALVKVSGWETMPLTQAAQAVQRSAFPGAYAKWEPMATAAVASLGRSPGGATGSNSVPGSGVSKAGVAAASPAAGATGRGMANAAFSVIKRSPPGHIRYSLGGDDDAAVDDPKVLDCSSFVDWAYYHSAGHRLNPNGRTVTTTEAQMGKDVSVPTGLATKGALLFLGGRGSEHHVEVSLGNGWTAAAHTDGIPLEQQVTVSKAGSSWDRSVLLPGLNYSDAATTPGAAQEISRVTGQPASTSDPNEFGPNALPGSIGGGDAAGGQAGQDGAAAFNAFVNVFAWGFQPNLSGVYLVGARALMNDEPILPYVANLMAAGMRSWCSAPNGDFIAWFPDYFGIWNSAAKMNVRSIELLDFTVDWYDQEIVTHQYVVGAPMAMFDTRSASVSGQSDIAWQIGTKGVATMDFPRIFSAIFGKDATTQFVNEYMSRFGGRPNMVNMPLLQRGNAEFFMALYLFMQRWANQFKADVPMTFMPELWPGMLLCLPEYQFQAYIKGVQHVFKFGKGGGFHTSAEICAPARTTQVTDIFGLLPLSGSARSG